MQFLHSQLHGSATYLMTNNPELLANDESNEIAQPPTITEITCTPAEINGDSMLAFVPLYGQESQKWYDLPHAEILAEMPFVGEGTSMTLYSTIEADATKQTKHESVRDLFPKTYTDEDETTHTTTEFRFGMRVGA